MIRLKSAGVASDGILVIHFQERQVAEMVDARGWEVDYTTVFRWGQEDSPEIDKRCRRELLPTNDAWRVDESYILVNGKQKYLS